MTFLFLSAGQALALLAAVVGAVVAIYVLKPPPLPLHVASKRLWERVIEKRDDRKERWRYILSLILALTIAVLVALALGGLERGRAAERQKTVIIVDNSPTSATRTRSGETRLERAVARAREIVADSAGDVLVADMAGQLGDLRFGDRSRAERRLDRISAQPGRRAHLPVLPDEEARLHLITDGVSSIQAPEDAVIHSVFEPATNVAITAFGSRRAASDRGRLQAAIEVVNGSLTPETPLLEIRADGEVLVERPVELTPGEAWSATIDLSGHAGKRIEARVLTAHDALPDDDRAEFVAGHRRQSTRVALEGDSPALELLLDSTPSLVRVGPTEAEVTVHVGADPAADPEGPSLFLSPASLYGTRTQRRESEEPLRQIEDHPSLTLVPWHSLRPTLLAPPSPPPRGELEPILMSADTPFLLRHRTLPVMVVAAELDTHLVSQTFFPEFIEAAVSALADQSQQRQTRIAASRDATVPRTPFVNRSPFARDEAAPAAETQEVDAEPTGSSRLWRSLLIAAAVLVALQGVTVTRRITV